jgi:hypothetical protein
MGTGVLIVMHGNDAGGCIVLWGNQGGYGRIYNTGPKGAIRYSGSAATGKPGSGNVDFFVSRGPSDPATETCPPSFDAYLLSHGTERVGPS